MIRRALTLATLLAGLCLATPAHALEPVDGGSPVLAEHRITVSFLPWYVDYKEDVPPPLKSTESGFQPGVALDWRGLFPWIYAAARGELTFFHTTYDGSLQNGEPLVDESRLVWWALEGQVGARLDQLFAMDRSALVAVYAGLAFTFWQRGLGGPSPFDEDYCWFHVPIGVHGEWAATGSLTLGLDVALLAMFGGQIRFELSDIDSGYNDPIAHLGNLPGVRLEALVSWSPVEHLQLSVRPYYAYTEIGQSDPVSVTDEGVHFQYVLEPPSRTHRVGAAIGIGTEF